MTLLSEFNRKALVFISGFLHAQVIVVGGFIFHALYLSAGYKGDCRYRFRQRITVMRNRKCLLTIDRIDFCAIRAHHVFGIQRIAVLIEEEIGKSKRLRTVELTGLSGITVYSTIVEAVSTVRVLRMTIASESS